MELPRTIISIMINSSYQFPIKDMLIRERNCVWRILEWPIHIRSILV